MKRGEFIASSLATVAVAIRGMARPPVPKFEIIDTIRDLAARELRIRKSDVDTRKSLAAQGLSESQLSELVIDINQEFGVVLSARAIFEAKQAEPVHPLSVMRLADMVEDRLRRPDFPE